MTNGAVTARITPKRTLKVLSRQEVNRLIHLKDNHTLYELFRRCAFAVLNCGSQSDDIYEHQQAYEKFEIGIEQLERGILIHLVNAPSSAFVDGDIIYGIREHLFTVLRDILYTHDEVLHSKRFDLESSEGLTNSVFHILRNAQIMRNTMRPNLAICWGGHSISRVEYEYTKEVGYQMGLRGLDVGTGCGPGAMKGPMKGATIGHAKQHTKTGRYVGITEPGIIAAEAPNPIVSELVILPDIEKRLEAFVRLAHGIVVFPGGVGTAEEILYLLGILLHPENKGQPYPFILTGPESSREYFEEINDFICRTVGKEATNKYEVIINDAERVAQHIKQGIKEVESYRHKVNDAYFFNWSLYVDPSLQHPFPPTFENMASLNLYKDQEPHMLASQLRRAFSGIVAGNVKEEGIKEVKKHGPYELSGDPEIIEPLDALLKSMVAQKRMKLPGSDYIPCFKVKK